VRADRLVAILLLLQSRGRTTVGELSRELEASERTIRRDLDALSAAGIPVMAMRGRGGGWEILGGHRTDLSGLSAAEAEALFLIAGPAALAAGLGVEPGLRSAIRKLLAALPAPLRERADTARSRVLVDPAGWGHEAPRPLPHLAALRSAVLEGRQVDLTYATPRRPPTTRRIHPYGLVSKAGTWYLVAGTAEGLRTFRVSRVEGVGSTGDAVVRPAGFDLETEWVSLRARVPAVYPSVAVEILADPELEGILERTLSGWARVERRAGGGADGDKATGDGEPIEGGDAGLTSGTAVGGTKILERRHLVAHLPNARVAALELARFTGWVEVLGPPEVRRELARLGAELIARHAPDGVLAARPS
jgi:predicted DNA-binding transcriptional regulator YafY